MKAKDYIVCGLLAAILAVCCFTSYTVIQEQKSQTEEQRKQTAIANEQKNLIENQTEILNTIKNQEDFIKDMGTVMTSMVEIEIEERIFKYGLSDVNETRVINTNTAGRYDAISRIAHKWGLETGKFYAYTPIIK